MYSCDFKLLKFKRQIKNNTFIALSSLSGFWL